MLFSFRHLLAVGLLTLAPAAQVARAADAAALWTGGVQALLDENCVKCHGPLKQKSGLELDSVASVLKGNEDGAVVVPGKPTDSPLLDALTADADPHMPPKKQLEPAEIAKIRAWIVALGEAKPPAPVAKLELPATMDPTEAIDRFLEDGWQKRKVAPAPVCDDRSFVRRVYLDLAGRIPTREEAEAFFYDASPKKREALIDRLLVSDEYARASREIWDALLMGRNAGRREQRRKDSGWYAFLESAFKNNRAWDEVVRAMIVARPEGEADKGSQWFVFERRNEYQPLAEAIAPVIYGTRIACAQCHDHPLAREIKQGHYWGLVAAFNRSKNVDNKGGGNATPVVAESAIGGFINFTNLKKESQPAVMMLLNGRTVDETRPADDAKQEDSPDEYVDPKATVKTPKFSRRAALADAVTRDNPLLARSFVNHEWAILLGRGIVNPVDEMNSKNPPSHPEMLDWLARDFTDHHYDMRRLTRAILLSRGYQLAAWTGENAPAPEAFAAAAEKPLTAETIARSAQVASGAKADDGPLRAAFAEAFPDVLPRVPRATIQQAMFLENNETLAKLFKPGTAAADRLATLPTNEDRVREVFRLALVREPEADELAAGVKYLDSRQKETAEAVGQMLWALVSGPEFLTNH